MAEDDTQPEHYSVVNILEKKEVEVDNLLELVGKGQQISGVDIHLLEGKVHLDLLEDMAENSAGTVVVDTPAV